MFSFRNVFNPFVQTIADFSFSGRPELRLAAPLPETKLGLSSLLATNHISAARAGIPTTPLLEAVLKISGRRSIEDDLHKDIICADLANLLNLPVPPVLPVTAECDLEKLSSCVRSTGLPETVSFVPFDAARSLHDHLGDVETFDSRILPDDPEFLVLITMMVVFNIWVGNIDTSTSNIIIATQPKCGPQASPPLAFIDYHRAFIHEDRMEEYSKRMFQELTGLHRSGREQDVPDTGKHMAPRKPINGPDGVMVLDVAWALINAILLIPDSLILSLVEKTIDPMKSGYDHERIKSYTSFLCQGKRTLGYRFHRRFGRAFVKPTPSSLIGQAFQFIAGAAFHELPDPCPFAAVPSLIAAGEEGDTLHPASALSCEQAQEIAVAALGQLDRHTKIAARHIANDLPDDPLATSAIGARLIADARTALCLVTARTLIRRSSRPAKSDASAMKFA